MLFYEHAESILFAEDLETKLSITPLQQLEDSGGPIVETPDRPGRPERLRMREKGEPGTATLPTRPGLVDDESRGRLLHFFANHELLATELMALALLKFPDAPRAFRQGLLHTMQEEQRHTRWYVNRMRECGVEFGSYPLSRFFWDSVAAMETPLDYVTRLSLTFEQANLDYSLHYAGIIEEAGDPKTAKILKAIYKDEIAHVGYGLKWFRKWKSGELSDWDAYRERLVFPLSPARAKGNHDAPFNREGRLASGLEMEFIDELAVYERSKGRTPNLHWFNPDAEAEMRSGVEGKGYAPRRAMSRLAEDLEILPAFLASRDDVVLMKTPPSREHRQKLRSFGLTLPEITTYDDELLKHRKIDGMKPWAWCPQAARTASRFRENQHQKESERSEWTTATRELFSKTTWADLGDGAICHSVEEVKLALARWDSIVIKSNFGNSGWGNQRIRAGEPKEKEVLAWVAKILSRPEETTLVVEPRREDRVFDFSVHFEMTDEGRLKRLGFVRLQNDGRGQFQGCSAGPRFCSGLPSDLARFIATEAMAYYHPESHIVSAIEKRLLQAGYRGPVGIDAFVYRDAEGLKLRPVCEVNPRYTMGRVAYELSKNFHSKKRSRFSLESSAPRETEHRIVLNEITAETRVFAVLELV